MRLSDQYRRQRAWRSWPTVLDALPALEGSRVVDLGCGTGDQAEMLASRGAQVVGVDGNEELLAVARARALRQARFVLGDLRALPELGPPADGIWCSFVPAYFPDLATVLERWSSLLRPGGWIALTEVDDLFAHEPLADDVEALLADYARESLEAGRYDFRMGGKLAEHLRRAGFGISRSFAVPDLELAFDGPAQPEVIEAWDARLERMHRLRTFCGPAFDEVRAGFARCLESPEHACSGRVCCCVGVKT